MKDPPSYFKEFCRKDRIRYTPERNVAIDMIFQEKGQFNIDKLFLCIQARYPKNKTLYIT